MARAFAPVCPLRHKAVEGDGRRCLRGKLYNKFWHGDVCMLCRRALGHGLSMRREQTSARLPAYVVSCMCVGQAWV